MADCAFLVNNLSGHLYLGSTLWIYSWKASLEKLIQCIVLKEAYPNFLFTGEIKTGSPSDYELEGLSNRITKWEALGRRLGFTDDELVPFDRDNREFTNKIFKMLLAWKQREGSRATYEVLYNALCHEYVMCRSLAEIFCFTNRGIKRNSLALDP